MFPACLCCLRDIGHRAGQPHSLWRGRGKRDRGVISGAASVSGGLTKGPFPSPQGTVPSHAWENNHGSRKGRGSTLAVRTEYTSLRMTQLMPWGQNQVLSYLRDPASSPRTRLLSQPFMSKALPTAKATNPSTVNQAPHLCPHCSLQPHASPPAPQTPQTQQSFKTPSRHPAPLAPPLREKCPLQPVPARCLSAHHPSLLSLS